MKQDDIPLEVAAAESIMRCGFASCGWGGSRLNRLVLSCLVRKTIPASSIEMVVDIVYQLFRIRHAMTELGFAWLNAGSLLEKLQVSGVFCWCRALLSSGVTPFELLLDAGAKKPQLLTSRNPAKIRTKKKQDLRPASLSSASKLPRFTPVLF
ncbi:MAG: hypothetical protein C0457_05590 [Polymorphum sp.]|nr:hypothetical protein [Polymorphum sp.]